MLLLTLAAGDVYRCPSEGMLDMWGTSVAISHKQSQETNLCTGGAVIYNESNSRSLSWSSKCLSGNAPTYLADDCQLISDVNTRQLRSTDTAMCVVWCSHNIFGDQRFATAGPHLWNSLRSKLWQCDTLGEFKWLLKTYLVGDHGALWLLLVKSTKKSSYLLTYLCANSAYDMKIPNVA